jgi:hypothetical protein
VSGRFLLGLTLGIALGGVAAVCLLPEPRARFRELKGRLAEIDGLRRGGEEAARIGQRTLAAFEERYRLALAEAYRASEDTRRQLWTRLGEATRQGQLPPG